MSKLPKKVLIIDDSPVMVKAMKKILKGEGYDVMDAWDAKTGIDLAKTGYPNLIVLDILFPDIDGKDILRELN